MRPSQLLLLGEFLNSFGCHQYPIPATQNTCIFLVIENIFSVLVGVGKIKTGLLFSVSVVTFVHDKRCVFKFLEIGEGVLIGEFEFLKYLTVGYFCYTGCYDAIQSEKTIDAATCRSQLAFDHRFKRGGCERREVEAL